MGDTGTIFRGISVAPRGGVGIITDGNPFKFNSSPFPHGATRLIGAELTVDFGKISENLPRRIGELAFLYYWGHAHDKVDPDDLPLGNDPLPNRVRFSSERESNSHYVLAEWRWPSLSPVHSTRHWAFINPQYTVGAGGIIINTKITQENAEPKEANAIALVV